MALEHIQQLFEHLQPGCNGVITNHASIPRASLKKAHSFMNEMWEGPPEGGDSRGFDDKWPEEGVPFPETEEGGGDGETDIHDEL